MMLERFTPGFFSRRQLKKHKRPRKAIRCTFLIKIKISNLHLILPTLRLRLPTLRVILPTLRLILPTLRLILPTLRLVLPTLRLCITLTFYLSIQLNQFKSRFIEAVVRRCCPKNIFLKISQIS